MQEEVEIRNLSEEDLPAMHEAFTKAFSDYSVNLRLNSDQFYHRIVEKLGIDFRYSVGAFEKEKLVAFIFICVGQYKGHSVAYNGGTGVIPAFRKKNLSLKLYQHVFNILQDTAVKDHVLEVISDNEKAIGAYEKIGFTRTILYHCYKLTSAKMLQQNEKFRVEISTDLEEILRLNLGETNPSYLDANENLKSNGLKEMVLVVKQQNEVAGYIVFQPKNGRISQFAVNKKFRRQGIGTALVAGAYQHAEQKYLTVLNVDTKAREVMAFLKYAGFENQVDQYEMSYTRSS